jgi:hypothetical protein
MASWLTTAEVPELPMPPELSPPPDVAAPPEVLEANTGMSSSSALNCAVVDAELKSSIAAATAPFALTPPALVELMTRDSNDADVSSTPDPDTCAVLLSNDGIAPSAETNVAEATVAEQEVGAASAEIVYAGSALLVERQAAVFFAASVLKVDCERGTVETALASSPPRLSPPYQSGPAHRSFARRALRLIAWVACAAALADLALVLFAFGSALVLAVFPELHVKLSPSLIQPQEHKHLLVFHPALFFLVDLSTTISIPFLSLSCLSFLTHSLTQSTTLTHSLTHSLTHLLNKSLTQ